jgi:dTDP-4-amino-4,6-dideoxygalactose transaminase
MPGDEVIVPAFTFGATASAVIHAGGRPVFVDIDEFFTVDPDAVAAAITDKTTAIVAVHLYGQMADNPALRAIATRHHLLFLEDAAQSLGAALKDEQPGMRSTATLSFYPTKNMTTGEGGAVLTPDMNLGRRVRRLRNHGMDGRYDYVEVGWNARMTSLGAAIGRVQLRHLAARNRQRNANASYLTAALATAGRVDCPLIRSGAHHVFHQYTIRVAHERDQMRAKLRRAGIETGLYYPAPLYDSSAFARYGDGSLPATEAACREVLSLPVHPDLSSTDLERVVGAVATS